MRQPKRVLSVFSLVMINVIAIDSLRTLPLSAEYGFSLIFYYCIAAVCFFIPTALVAAELATGWPQTGGLYIWVREAFGKRAGFITIWLQWIYNVVWYPTILAFLAAALSYLVDPAWASNKWFILITILSLFWLITFANCFGMRLSSWISNIGAVVGTLLPMLFIVSLALYWGYIGKPLQIHFSFHSLVPDLSQAGNLAFLIAVFFGLAGMEMSAVHAEEVKNPQRDYPRALLISSILIMTSLVAASLAIALVLPADKINLVTGLIDAFDLFLQQFHLTALLPLVILCIIIGGISGVAAWVIGPSKGLLVAALDGCISKRLGKTNRHGAPSRILLLQGGIFSVLSCAFLLMPTVSSTFWLLSAITAQLALMVYILMFAAAIRLRHKAPQVVRNFKIPGGLIGISIVGSIGIISCLTVMWFGFIPPTQVNVGSTVRYETLLIGGTLIFCLLPLCLMQKKANQES